MMCVWNRTKGKRRVKTHDLNRNCGSSHCCYLTDNGGGGGRGREGSTFAGVTFDFRRGLRVSDSFCHSDLRGEKVLEASESGGGSCTSVPWLDARKIACNSCGILLDGRASLVVIVDQPKKGK